MVVFWCLGCSVLWWCWCFFCGGVFCGCFVLAVVFLVWCLCGGVFVVVFWSTNGIVCSRSKKTR